MKPVYDEADIKKIRYPGRYFDLEKKLVIEQFWTENS